MYHFLRGHRRLMNGDMKTPNNASQPKPVISPIRLLDAPRKTSNGPDASAMSAEPAALMAVTSTLTRTLCLMSPSLSVAPGWRSSLAVSLR